MAVIVEKYALNLQEDLTTPTADQKYPLGMEVVVNDTDVFARKRYKYVKAAHSALTAYVPYQLANAYTTGAEWATRAAIKCTNSLVGVPSVAFTSNYYGFLQVEGKCYAIGTSGFSAGNKLQLGNGLAVLSLCTTGVDYAESQACAICLVSTTVATQYVNLSGYRVTCT
jgi:hypothetical protein